MTDLKLENGVENGVWQGADGVGYRYGPSPVRTCKEPTCRKNFNWDGSDYKVYCPECFQKKVRKCIGCKINNLAVDAPSWSTLCTDCFVKRKSVTHGTCPTCPPSRAHHMRRPLAKAHCAECEQRLRPFLPEQPLPEQPQQQ